jgi:hypothetical protein
MEKHMRLLAHLASPHWAWCGEVMGTGARHPHEWSAKIRSTFVVYFCYESMCNTF